MTTKSRRRQPRARKASREIRLENEAGLHTLSARTVSQFAEGLESAHEVSTFIESVDSGVGCDAKD